MISINTGDVTVTKNEEGYTVFVGPIIYTDAPYERLKQDDLYRKRFLDILYDIEEMLKDNKKTQMKNWIRDVRDLKSQTTKNSIIIDSFEGEYEFLSNFYLANVEYEGLTYTSSESAYQASKFTEGQENFIGLAPMESKKLARKNKELIRKDWNGVKFFTMLNIVREKFKQNEYLASKLLATGNAKLIEGNYWNDTYWGVCEGQGSNKLGAILMKVRQELKKEKKINKDLVADKEHKNERYKKDS